MNGIKDIDFHSRFLKVVFFVRSFSFALFTFSLIQGSPSVNCRITPDRQMVIVPVVMEFVVCILIFNKWGHSFRLHPLTAGIRRTGRWSLFQLLWNLLFVF
jgi:hypothetical protein